MNKTCPRCKETKSLDLFHNWYRSKDKRQTYCKECQKVMDKVQREKRKARGPIITRTDKICRICADKKPISQFGKKSTSNDGHIEYCKPCWTIYVKRAKQRQRRGIL